MKRIAVVTALAIWISALAYADNWCFPAEVTEKEYEFGKSKIVLKVDATEDQYYPEHTLYIYLDGELMAQYKNIGFQAIFASPENDFFLGVSNSGIPGTAFVIFDKQGNLIREEKLRYMDLSICSEISVTLVRRWYDAENPDVEFITAGGNLSKVLIRGSKGKTYNLLYRDSKYRNMEEVVEKKKEK